MSILKQTDTHEKCMESITKIPIWGQKLQKQRMFFWVENLSHKCRIAVCNGYYCCS